MNPYEYLSSNPWTSSDPLGLYEFEDAYEDLTDIMGLRSPLPGASDMARSVLNEMVSEYAANLEWDVDWATDWSLPDDAYSRTSNAWVTQAITRGMYKAFEIALPFTDGTVNPLDLLADGGRRGGGLGSINSSLRTRKTGGNFVQKWEWTGPKGDTYSAKKFRPIGYKQAFVKFGSESKLREVDIGYWRHTRAQDNAEANRLLKKNAGYDWSNDFKFPCTWHHDHKKPGRMYLVPRWLHEAVNGHVGRAMHWP